MSDVDKEKQNNGMHSSWFKNNGDLDWRQLAGKALIFAALALVVYSIAHSFIRSQDWPIDEWVNSHMGLKGIFLFVFFVDMLIVPMSADLIFPFTLTRDPVSLLLVMSSASAVGGYAGYWIGRLVGHLPFIKKFTSGFTQDGERLIHKYGVWAVVIAGITPIPFSTVCWMTGMLKVSPWQVALATLSRFPRMIVYFLAFKGGFSFTTH